MSLTSRQEEVLTAVVHLYVKMGEPVSSKQLCEGSGFDCSPATLRNEMAALEEEGYLLHEHTSSGRIPTDKGYRHFVDIHGRRDLSKRDQVRLQEEFVRLQARYARLARITAKLLAQEGHGIGFSSVPEAGLSFESGLADLLRGAQSEAGEAGEELTEAAEAIEQLDEHSGEILDELERRGTDLEVYIGGENPHFQFKHVSMLLAPAQFPDGSRGFVALVGPKRMPYGRNMSVMQEIQKLLSGGTGMTMLLLMPAAGLVATWTL